MHVVQLVPSLATGGMETMVLHLASWLHTKGVSVDVLYFEGDPDAGQPPVARGVPIRRVRLTPYAWRYWPLQLIRLLAGREDVVLHGHLYAWHKGTAVARWRAAANVYTQHAPDGDWVRKQLKEMRRSARATQAAVGVSAEICRFLAERLEFPSDWTYLVPNGVPDLLMERPPPAEWGFSMPTQHSIVGMVGRLAQPKDHGTLVEAMRLVRAEVPQAQLVLIGSGPDESRIRRQIQERGAGGFVHLLGDRRDVALLLHHLDVLVLSSRSEGHSMAILEAMSTRRPIVATRVGGNAHLLDEGRCGVLTTPGEPEEMAGAIVRLLHDRDEAQRLAALARRRFLEHFSVDRMGAAYLEIYREALTRRRAGSG